GSRGGERSGNACGLGDDFDDANHASRRPGRRFSARGLQPRATGTSALVAGFHAGVDAALGGRVFLSFVDFDLEAVCRSGGLLYGGAGAGSGDVTLGPADLRVSRAEDVEAIVAEPRGAAVFDIRRRGAGLRDEPVETAADYFGFGCGDGGARICGSYRERLHLSRTGQARVEQRAHDSGFLSDGAADGAVISWSVGRRSTRM